jgi:hypothetical protein
MMQQTRRLYRESSASAPKPELATGRVRPTGGLDWALRPRNPMSEVSGQLAAAAFGESALVAGGAQSFHLSAQHNHSRSDAFVLLRDSYDRPFDGALVDKALKFFVNTQTQHLFAATGCVSLPQIEEHDFEQRLEFERGLRRKHSD